MAESTNALKRPSKDIDELHDQSVARDKKQKLNEERSIIQPKAQEAANSENIPGKTPSAPKIDVNPKSNTIKRDQKLRTDGLRFYRFDGAEKETDYIDADPAMTAVFDEAFEDAKAKAHQLNVETKGAVRSDMSALDGVIDPADAGKYIDRSRVQRWIDWLPSKETSQEGVSGAFREPETPEDEDLWESMSAVPQDAENAKNIRRWQAACDTRRNTYADVDTGYHTLNPQPLKANEDG